MNTDITEFHIPAGKIYLSLILLAIMAWQYHSQPVHNIRIMNLYGVPSLLSIVAWQYNSQTAHTILTK